MVPLTALLPHAVVAEPCLPDENTCERVLNWTGNDRLAEVADLVIGKPLAIITIVVVGFVARWLLHRVVDRIVRKAEDGVLPDRLNKMTVGRSQTENGESAQSRRMQRARTMGDLLKSVITGVLVAVVITMILAELDYEIGPILASAGIVGVALGFGAQNLVKDFLSGIFMIFEDQLGVGDSVDLGEASGTVEAVSLRVTRLRDVNGTVWYVRNGEILRVGNQSQNWARTVLDVTFPYREDVDPRAPRAAGGRRRPLARRRLRPRDHRAARGLGHRGRHRRRDHHAGHAEDRAAGAVAGRPGDARPHQVPLRRRGHQRAVRPHRRGQPEPERPERSRGRLNSAVLVLVARMGR